MCKRETKAWQGKITSCINLSTMATGSASGCSTRGTVSPSAAREIESTELTAVKFCIQGKVLEMKSGSRLWICTSIATDGATSAADAKDFGKVTTVLSRVGSDAPEPSALIDAARVRVYTVEFNWIVMISPGVNPPEASQPMANDAAAATLTIPFFSKPMSDCCTPIALSITFSALRAQEGSIDANVGDDTKLCIKVTAAAMEMLF